jgi:hypothetical protein
MSELTKIVVTATITVIAKEILTGFLSSAKRKFVEFRSKPISPETAKQISLFFLPMFDSLAGFLIGTGVLVSVVLSAALRTKPRVAIIAFLAIYASWGFHDLVEMVFTYQLYRKQLRQGKPQSAH